MRKTAYIVLSGSLGLTFVFLSLWILVFVFALVNVGGLIHLLLILAVLTSFGVPVGIILLLVSHFRK